MTQDVKNEIILAINEATGHVVSDSRLIDAGNRVEKIVDEALAKALEESCQFGEILRAVGLEIKSSGA